jgi:PAS domain S-box-containing protein
MNMSNNNMIGNENACEREVDSPVDVVFVTKTDTRGCITYANDAFVEVSGYSREELIGKNHNIVRHPDMPKWAFADLWATIQGGHPWRGIVKNRTINGGFYWVRATVSPVVEDNKVVGYMSLRRKPTRQEIAVAEELYRHKDAPHNSYSLMRWFNRLSLKTKMNLSIQITMLIILAISTVSVAYHINERMIDAVRRHAGDIANEVIDGANMLMVTGQISDVETRKLLVQKIGSSGNIVSLRLIRNANVAKQFGAGLPEEQLDSELQKSVVESKKPYYSIETKDGKKRIHAIFPYLALTNFHGTNCLSCHQVEENAVLGVSDTYIDMAEDYASLYQVVGFLLAGLAAVQVLIYFMIGWIVRRFVTKPVDEITANLNCMVNGDMSGQVDISGRDEMGNVLCSVQTSKIYLASCFDRVMTVSEKLHQANKLSETVAKISDSSQIQSQAASSIASSVEQMTVSIEQITQNSSEVQRVSERSKEAADNGEKAVKLVVDEMSRIYQAVDDVSRNINMLGAKSEQIKDIVKTIREIADQTNLLALNAAIEAARAGEAGRGFAVVADEVRKLAEKTGSATEQIAMVVNEINDDTLKAVNQMVATVDMVKDGSVLVEKTGVVIAEISEGAFKVLNGAKDILSSLREQSSASREISVNVERVAQLSEQNNTALKGVSVAADTLREQVVELDESVAQFKF